MDALIVLDLERLCVARVLVFVSLVVSVLSGSDAVGNGDSVGKPVELIDGEGTSDRLCVVS